MPRYKQKKPSPLKPINPWIRNSIVVAIVVTAILLAGFTVKKFFGKTTPVYGGTVAQQFMSKKSLIKKVNELQSTLTAYDAEITTLRQLQNENDALKAEFGRVQLNKGVLGHVITLPNRSFYDSMLIDAGSAEGVQPGATAYAFNSIAIGTVSDVTEHTATVWLFSAPGRQTTGTAVGNNVSVTLVGRGGGEYEVQLPRDVPFTVGDMVSAQSAHVASLAVVEKVITDPRDPFQRLLAKVPVNLQALKFVVVR